MAIPRLILAIFLSIAATADGARAEAGFSAGLSQHQVTVDGEKRHFFLYVPRSANRGGPIPLVIGFHGGGGKALGFGKRTGLRQLAEWSGAIVALPQGLGAPGARGGTWNVESASPVGFADREDVADLKFMDTMISRIQAGQPIDTAKIFATGLSQGGMMALRLACERPGLLAAVAPVAGTLASGRCAHPGSTDVLHIHGSADQNVPFEGGRGTYSNRAADWTSVPDSMAALFGRGSCDRNAKTIKVTQDTACTISGCSGGHSRQLCVVEGGGHGWPGIAPAAWQRKRGQYISPLFNATAHIGRFFFGR